MHQHQRSNFCIFHQLSQQKMAILHLVLDLRQKVLQNIQKEKKW